MIHPWTVLLDLCFVCTLRYVVVSEYVTSVYVLLSWRQMRISPLYDGGHCQEQILPKRDLTITTTTAAARNGA